MKTKNIITLLVIAAIGYFFYTQQKKKETQETTNTGTSSGSQANNLQPGFDVGQPMPYQPPTPQMGAVIIKPALGLNPGTSSAFISKPQNIAVATSQQSIR